MVIAEVQIVHKNLLLVRQGIEPPPHDIYEEGRFAAELLKQIKEAYVFSPKELVVRSLFVQKIPGSHGIPRGPRIFCTIFFGFFETSKNRTKNQ